MSDIDVDEIRRQMAEIRREMHTNVSNVVSDVGQAMDWRSPIRNHPYLAVGAGLIAGFFLVPRKAAPAPSPPANLAPEPLANLAPRRPDSSRPARPKSLTRQALGWGLGMAWPLVGQSVQAYAAMWLEDQIKRRLNPNASPPSSSGGRPGEPRRPHDHASAARRG